MVKNLPTIERSTKIRFGKHANDDQAENTIVFNASDSTIDASQSGSMYMTPLRVAEIAGSTFLGYVPGTKEVVNTGVLTSLLGGVTLESAANQGNTISNVVQFSNVTTAFVTSSNVGIANTAPTHALSVKNKVFIGGPISDSDDLRVEGNTKTNKLQTGTVVTLDKNATNKIQVSGIIKSTDLHVDKIGISNTAPTHAISIGGNGEVQMNIPTGTVYALDTVGNVNAQNYRGDGGLLSNVTIGSTINAITLNANVNASNVVSTDIYGTIKGSNTVTAMTLTGNVAASNVVSTDIYGTIKGSNTVTAITLNANVNASNLVTADGRGINQLNASNVSIGTIAIARGGTGAVSASTAASALGLGVEDQPSFITVSANVNASNIVTADGRGINQLNASNVSIGTIAIARGGTGAASASTAASALGLGVEDQPSFVTVISNVIAHNVASTSLTNGIIPYVHSTKQLRDSKLSFNDTSYVTTISSNVAITGNLVVDGNITAQHTTDHYITDKIFAVAYNNSVDAKDMGQHMERPTANVFAGFLGQTMSKEYTIAYTTSKSESQTITPTISTSDGYITANVWGNVLASNVISRGLVEGATLKGDGSAITALNMGNASTGALAIARGGTGAATLNNLITMGTHTTGDFVGTITGGDGIASTGATSGEDIDHTLSIDAKANGGLVIESNELAVDLGASSITGTLAIDDGGTGAVSASAAASALGVGTEDSPQFTGIELGHATDTTLARSSAGVVTIEGAEIRTGTVPINKGGTGSTNSQPSFVTVNANVNASNVISESIKLTDPAITASLSSTNTLNINAKNRSYGTTSLIVLADDLDSFVHSNFINGSQIVVPLIANGADRKISKTLSNVNWYVQTDDVTISQNDQALMTLSNVAGNVYMNAITFTSGS